MLTCTWRPASAGPRYRGAPLKVAVLCSRRAPGLLHLLDRDGERGRSYEIVCCLTSEKTFAEEVCVERRGIPTVSHPIGDFYLARGASVQHDAAIRAEFDARTVELLKPYSPDLLLLDGYLYLLTDRMLSAFPSRILNLHFSDLTMRLPDGGPRFPGTRSVRDALAAGCTETRATVHLVNEEVDGGPPIVRSWPLPVSPLVAEARARHAVDMFKAYAFAHQQWMFYAIAGPLWAAALRIVSEPELNLAQLASIAPHTVVPWELDAHEILHAPTAVAPAAREATQLVSARN